MFAQPWCTHFLMLFIIFARRQTTAEYIFKVFCLIGFVIFENETPHWNADQNIYIFLQSATNQVSKLRKSTRSRAANYTLCL